MTRRHKRWKRGTRCTPSGLEGKQEARLLNKEKKNSSDAEETDGASQQDTSSPWPCLKEMSEILGSGRSSLRLTFIIFCIFISLEVGKVEL